MKRSSRWIGLFTLNLLIYLSAFISTFAQQLGDYRSFQSGDWDDPASWELFDGVTWIASPDFPDNPAASVTISPGHEIIFNESNAGLNDLAVEAGGKLFCNSSGVYRYLAVYGNISCNGTIGNGPILDGISLKPEGDTCEISGTGDCRFRRARKDSGTNPTTVLVIDLHLEILYDGTGDALYNNSPGTTLDIQINPLASLHLHGSLDLAGCLLTLHSGSSGTGQLICPNIQNHSPGNSVVEQYIASDNSWHFLSSPVQGQAIQPVFVPDPINNSFDFYKWDEGALFSEAWVNIRDNNGQVNPLFETDMITGKGYLVAYSPAYSGNAIKVFEGEIHDGDQSLPISASSNYWNLIGNPYPCGLDWSSDGVDRSLAAGTALYFWDPQINYPAGGYRTHNGVSGVPASTSPVIPPMNGFFIHSTGNGTIDIDISVDEPLVISGQQFYKKLKDPIASMRFTVARGEYTDEALVGFATGFHDQYMEAEDALKLFRSHPEIPEIFSEVSGKPLVINNLSEGYPWISIGYAALFKDSLSIVFSGMESCDPGMEIWLDDLLAGGSTDLRKQDTYSFVSDSGWFTDRFRIRFEQVSTNISPIKPPTSIRTKYFGSTLKISNPESLTGVVNIVDASGKSIRTERLTGEVAQEIPFNQPQGVYLIIIRSHNQVYTGKVLTF